MAFRARLRFRVAKKFNVAALDTRFQVGGHEVVLASGQQDTNLKNAEIVIMEACGFPDDESARKFGLRLKAALIFASAVYAIGMDLGSDNVTLGFSQLIKDAVRAKTGEEIRDTVHGLDVYDDSVPVAFPSLRVRGAVSFDPAPVFTQIAEGFDQLPEKLGRSEGPLALFNSALVHREDYAKIVLAVAAVEMLAGTRPWSKPQRALIDHAIEATRSGNFEISGGERSEVIGSLERCRNSSVGEAVRALLLDLGLATLQEPWRNFYRQRSQLFHGEKVVEIGVLAADAIKLCGRIVLKGAQKDGATSPARFEERYPL